MRLKIVYTYIYEIHIFTLSQRELNRGSRLKDFSLVHCLCAAYKWTEDWDSGWYTIQLVYVWRIFAHMRYQSYIKHTQFQNNDTRLLNSPIQLFASYFIYRKNFESFAFVLSVLFLRNRNNYIELKTLTISKQNTTEHTTRSREKKSLLFTNICKKKSEKRLNLVKE